MPQRQSTLRAGHETATVRPQAGQSKGPGTASPVAPAEGAAQAASPQKSAIA